MFIHCGLVGLVFMVLSFSATAARAADSGTEIRERTVLRVCSDPSNLPFSNRLRQGFENKIAELLAENLDVPLVYTWFPQSVGFVRVTLRTRQCDLVLGISESNELLLNTNAYYTSAFALVYPADKDYDLVSLSDEVLREKRLRIGVVAGTPPVNLLLERGLMEQVSSYHLIVDTRQDSPAKQIVKDITADKLDVGVLWGPIAGYLNSRQQSSFKVVPLIRDDSDRFRMIYRITMGVRRGEINWKRQLNRFIRRNEEAIRSILLSYGAPLIEE